MTQYFHANFGDKLKGKHKVCKAFDEYDVRLCQRGKDRFAVVYGKQVDDELTYSDACDKLGQALLHAMACNDEVDNRIPWRRGGAR